MNINDLAKDMLSKRELQQISFMVMNDVKRGDTIRLRGDTQALFAHLEQRAAELEAKESLNPDNNLDWMALAFFGKDRARFNALCKEKEAAKDRTYIRVNYWLDKIMNDEEIEEA